MHLYRPFQQQLYSSTIIVAQQESNYETVNIQKSYLVETYFCTKFSPQPPHQMASENIFQQMSDDSQQLQSVELLREQSAALAMVHAQSRKYIDEINQQLIEKTKQLKESYADSENQKRKLQIAAEQQTPIAVEEKNKPQKKAQNNAKLGIIIVVLAGLVVLTTTSLIIVAILLIQSDQKPLLQQCENDNIVVNNCTTDCTNGSASGNQSCASNCAQGTFSYQVNSAPPITCQSCQGGTFSSSGASSCNICNAGYFSQIGAALCTICTVGQFSLSGASYCSNCSVGYQSLAGSSECIICIYTVENLSFSGNSDICECGSSKFYYNVSSTQYYCYSCGYNTKQSVATYNNNSCQCFSTSKTWVSGNYANQVNDANGCQCTTYEFAQSTQCYLCGYMAMSTGINQATCHCTSSTTKNWTLGTTYLNQSTDTDGCQCTVNQYLLSSNMICYNCGYMTNNQSTINTQNSCLCSTSSKNWTANTTFTNTVSDSDGCACAANEFLQVSTNICYACGINATGDANNCTCVTGNNWISSTSYANSSSTNGCICNSSQLISGSLCYFCGADSNSTGVSASLCTCTTGNIWVSNLTYTSTSNLNNCSCNTTQFKYTVDGQCYLCGSYANSTPYDATSCRCFNSQTWLQDITYTGQADNNSCQCNSSQYMMNITYICYNCGTITSNTGFITNVTDQLQYYQSWCVCSTSGDAWLNLQQTGLTYAMVNDTGNGCACTAHQFWFITTDPNNVLLGYNNTCLKCGMVTFYNFLNKQNLCNCKNQTTNGWILNSTYANIANDENGCQCSNTGWFYFQTTNSSLAASNDYCFKCGSSTKPQNTYRNANVINPQVCYCTTLTRTWNLGITYTGTGDSDGC